MRQILAFSSVTKSIIKSAATANTARSQIAPTLSYYDNQFQCVASVGRTASRANKDAFYSSSTFSKRFMGTYKAGPVTLMPVNTIEVPTMGDSITEGTIVELPVEPGEYVSEDDVVAVLETDKVSVDIRAPEAGVLVEILGEIDDVVEVGAGLYKLDTDGVNPGGAGVEGAVEVETAPLAVAESVAAAVVDTTPPPSPTPPSAAPAPKPTPAAAATPPPPAPATSGTRNESRVKMTRMRQRIGARLKEAQNTAAMLTTFQEVDMGNLMELRSQYKDTFIEKHGIKLGFMSAFVKASTAMLMEIPAVNANIDEVTNEIVYKDYCDVSVAVASPAGLVVPVLRNTEQMSFADVEKSIANHAKNAREGKLALEDMAGGTFTISNGGVYGSLMSTPIINMPQSAILGMHNTKLRPVVNPSTGEIESRPMMYLALTYDHRLIDGREAATFLKGVAEKIGDPQRMLLEL